MKIMSELKLEFVGKKVKDMYGTYIGKVIGIVTDIDGSIESVSVDCGSTGIKNLPYERAFGSRRLCHFYSKMET